MANEKCASMNRNAVRIDFVFTHTSASLGIAELYYRWRNSLELSLKKAAKAINNKRKLESLLIRLTLFG